MMQWYLASGDWNYWWDERIRSLTWLPQVFDPATGQSHLLSLWLDYPFRLTVKILSTLGLSWFVIEKFLWLSLVAVAIYSSYRLARRILGGGWLTWLSSLIYTTNTYFLLLVGGGQLGVAWAYAFAPWVLLKFIQTIDDSKKLSWRQGIINGLFFGLLIVFDLRFAYLALFMSGLYALFRRKLPVVSWAISLLTAGFVHAFWIIPVIFAGGGMGRLSEEFTGTGMLRFLSVADFSHALALLHPNWPENLFGKVYFLQPEFLIIPLLAFGALLFKDAKTRFFVLLGLVGAFLAKGAQLPFGSLFEWMFMYVPGFVMFRDPTKFYLFIAIAYSILIPFTLERIANVRKLNSAIPLAVFILFWMFTLRAIFMGQVSGNFHPTALPQEYVELKNLLVTDSAPSRTLWIPQKENYAYASATHPLLATGSAFVQDPIFMEKISDMGVGYVIVPADVNKRLFLTDYTFDPGQREALVSALQETSLEQNTAFRDIAVFKNDQFTFKQNVPAGVREQQDLANKGALVSAVSLLFFGVFLAITRKKI